MMLCGKFVFAITTAPRAVSTLTMVALEVAGSKARPT
jgi:hypothetical protein